MKKKGILIVSIILAIILLIVVLIKVQNKRDARYFKKQTFENTTNIVNYTEYERLDTIIFVLSENIFEFDTLNVNLYYIPKVLKNDRFEYYALVQELPFGYYSIFIKKGLKLHKIKSILSHEFIHIEQYKKGDLEVYPNYATYKGEYIPFKTIEYKDRTYEIEAFKRQNKICKQLNNILY